MNAYPINKPKPKYLIVKIVHFRCLATYYSTLELYPAPLCLIVLMGRRMASHIIFNLKFVLSCKSLKPCFLPRLPPALFCSLQPYTLIEWLLRIENIPGRKKTLINTCLIEIMCPIFHMLSLRPSIALPAYVKKVSSIFNNEKIICHENSYSISTCVCTCTFSYL